MRGLLAFWNFVYWFFNGQSRIKINHKMHIRHKSILLSLTCVLFACAQRL